MEENRKVHCNRIQLKTGGLTRKNVDFTSSKWNWRTWRIWIAPENSSVNISIQIWPAACVCPRPRVVFVCGKCWVVCRNDATLDRQVGNQTMANLGLWIYPLSSKWGYRQTSKAAPSAMWANFLPPHSGSNSCLDISSWYVAWKVNENHISRPVEPHIARN
jgi:hypothetical protein